MVLPLNLNVLKLNALVLFPTLCYHLERSPYHISYEEWMCRYYISLQQFQHVL